jgi:hypothetical protein
MAIWQDLVADRGFLHGNQTVKRFVHKLRGSTEPQALGIIQTVAGGEAEVDYGSGPMVCDPQSGKHRRTLTLGRYAHSWHPRNGKARSPSSRKNARTKSFFDPREDSRGFEPTPTWGGDSIAAQLVE